MVYQLESPTQTEIIYPESDGKPMADNTIQFHLIMVIYHNLAWLFANDPLVFVAGDLLWYPVEREGNTCQAPDVMVIFGVAKGHRGSYKQWEEGDIAPQIVFEILSPSNTKKEMDNKLVFYNDHGVEEYYLYNPKKNELSGWLRSGSGLEAIEEMNNWVSPRLGISFKTSGEELQLYRPDGKPFATYIEIQKKLEQSQQELEKRDQELEKRDQEIEKRDQEIEKRDQELDSTKQELAKLKELLRDAGVDINQTN